jgi:hypothetical protein
MIKHLWTLAVVLAAPLPALAQGGDASCPAVAAPPTELAGWSAQKRAVVAGTNAASAARMPAIGSAAAVALHPIADVRFPVVPRKADQGHGGILVFTVDRPGTYRIALSAGAWIDLVSGSALLEATGHGHGAACTGIRKMVDFALAPGRYVLEIANSAQPEITLLIVPLR